YEAFMYTDAIIRINWRMIVSGKKLLEWTASASASKNTDTNAWSVYKTMWIGPLLALVSAILLVYTNPTALAVASSLLVLWILAPAIAWILSEPETEKPLDLEEEQTRFLHKSARKTWSFFERFVSQEENWMPPDNFQEQPVPVIAHRTSPTNMGLALLANLSA